MNFITKEDEKQETNRNIIENNNHQPFDNTDFKIISLLCIGQDNKKISSTLKIPLSTIQRRTRRIFQSGIVKVEYTPNFNILGIKKGLLHTYLQDGQLRETARKISEMEGILSTSIHVGNSDVVSDFVYERSEDLVEIISKIKHLEGVDRALWSEELIKLPSHKENIMKSFEKYWNSNNSNKKKELL